MRSDCDCPECGGGGEVECNCCGSELSCALCNGSGFDLKRFDFDRWELDHYKASVQWNGSAALVRDGKEVGRQSINRALAKGPEYADEVLYYADYAKGAGRE